MHTVLRCLPVLLHSLGVQYLEKIKELRNSVFNFHREHENFPPSQVLAHMATTPLGSSLLSGKTVCLKARKWTFAYERTGRYMLQNLEIATMDFQRSGTLYEYLNRTLISWFVPLHV